MCRLKECVPLFFSLCLALVSASYAGGDKYGSATGDTKPMTTNMRVSPEQTAMPLVLPAETADPTIPAASPQQVVEHAIAEMRAALFQARGNLKKDPFEIFRAIDRIISHNADMPRVSRLMLRRHWGEATDGQREQLVTLFHRFALKLLTLTNSTASAKDGSGGIANITFLPGRISDNDADRAMVHTLVSFKDAEDLRVNYRLCKDQGAWKIYDVMVGGISFVKLMQASVSSVVRRRGVDGLINLLERKVEHGTPPSTQSLQVDTQISHEKLGTASGKTAMR